MDPAARARASARRLNANQWPLRAHPVGEEPVRDPLDRSTVNERVAVMWPLTNEAWSVAGKTIPGYARAASPGRMLRQRP